MNAEEYLSIRCPPKRKPLSAKDLVGKTPRTLLFGYTIDSATAIRVYEAAGIPDVGRQVIVAKAGATSVSVVNNSATDSAQISWNLG